MSSLSKSAIYTLLTQVPTQVFGIIAGIFITRILGSEGRGLYAIFYADIALFATILGFSINTSIVHFSANGKLSESKILGLSSIFSVVTLFLCIIVLAIWINLPFADLLFPKDYDHSFYIVWFILLLIVNQINSVYSSIFQGAKKFNVVNKVSLINSILNLLTFGIAYLIHLSGVYHFFILEVLFLGLFVMVSNFIVWHLNYIKLFGYTIDLSIKWKQDILPFFKFSGIGHLSNVINFFNYRLVLWVIAYYLDNKQIGIFSLGAGLAQLLTFVSSPLAQVLMPYLSGDTPQKRITIFGRFARIHFTGLIFISLLGVLIAPFAIPFLYGEEFRHSAHIFQLMIVGILLSCQTNLIATFFVSSNKIILNLIATIIGFLLTFLFNFYLVKSFGINGAAIAQSITYIGIFLFVYIALIKFSDLRLINIFIITKEDLKYARERFVKKAGNY